MGRLAQAAAVTPDTSRYACAFGDWLDSLDDTAPRGDTSDREDVAALVADTSRSAQWVADRLAEVFGVDFLSERIRVHRRGSCATCRRAGRF